MWPLFYCTINLNVCIDPLTFRNIFLGIYSYFMVKKDKLVHRQSLFTIDVHLCVLVVRLLIFFGHITLKR